MNKIKSIYSNLDFDDEHISQDHNSYTAEKIIRKAHKKLKEIDHLLSDLQDGKQLNDNQIEKIKDRFKWAKIINHDLAEPVFQTKKQKEQEETKIINKLKAKQKKLEEKEKRQIKLEEIKRRREEEAQERERERERAWEREQRERAREREQRERAWEREREREWDRKIRPEPKEAMKQPTIEEIDVTQRYNIICKTENDKTKVYRRLMFEFHPDKNNHRIEYATNACKIINNQYKIMC